MTQSKARERRAALLREFEISGLSLAEFCRRAGLAYSTVLGWRRKAREEVAPSPSSPGFVVVEALPAEAGTGLPPSSGPGPDGRSDRSMETPVMKRGGTEQSAEVRELADWRFQAAAVGAASPPWRVELELPGGLTLRIYGDFIDRGGGGGSPPAASGKGGAP